MVLQRTKITLSKRNGATIIELLCVVAIISLMFAFTAPLFQIACEAYGLPVGIWIDVFAFVIVTFVYFAVLWAISKAGKFIFPKTRDDEDQPSDGEP